MKTLNFSRAVFHQKQRYAAGENVVSDELADFFLNLKHKDGTPFATKVGPPKEEDSPYKGKKKAELQTVYLETFGVDEVTDSHTVKELISALESKTPFEE